LARQNRRDRQKDADDVLFTAEFLRLMATGATYMLAIGALTAILPLYVVDELDGTEATAGIIMGSMAITALLSRAFVGRMADRQGARRLIGGGSAVTAVSILLLFWWPTITGAVASRLIMGAGSAAFFVGTSVRAMELAPQTRRSQAAAYHLIAFHAGMGLGPLLGERVLDNGGYSTAWLSMVVVISLASILSWSLTHRPGDRSALPSPRIHRNAILPGLVTLFGVFAFSGYLMFAALYADEIGLENVGPVFLVSSATMIVARVVFGRVPDLIGPIRAGTIALVLTVGAAVLLALWNEPAGLYTGAALVALGLALQSPSFMVIAIDGVGERERGSALATYTAFFDIANALIGPVIGIIVATSGYRAAFFTAAAAACVGLAILRLAVAPRWAQTTNSQN
jgi:MFS family permease